MKTTLAPQCQWARRRAPGSTLIEVLVTIVVVSIGLLGIAGMIGNGLKNNHSSYARSQATWLAVDIIDRMRANRLVAQGADQPYALALGSNPSGNSIAALDLKAWRAALNATLPSGTGSVALDATTLKVTATVQWDDSRAAGGSNVQTTVVETRL